MKKLYLKSELAFSLLWIGLYVVLFSVADNFSHILKIEKVITAPLSVALSALLLLWLKKSDLLNKYGLCRISGKYKTYLYFLPFVILASCNFWNGLTVSLSPLESLLCVVSMLCVGFIEEIIFRGFLFKAICKDNVKSAIAISSITFGIGHIVNLLNGADVLPTMLQILYATAVGFAFTVLFYKSGSIIPCILTHSVVNATSVFGIEGSMAMQVFSAAVITVIATLYGIFVLLKTKDISCEQSTVDLNE